MLATPIKLHCPHCGTPVDVAAPFGGGIVSCTSPSCGKEFAAEPSADGFKTFANGDINAQNDNAENVHSRPDPEGEAAFTYEAADERILAVYHSPMIRRHPLRFLGNVALIIAGMGGIIFAIARASMPLAIVSVLLAGTGVVLIALWYWGTAQFSVKITTTSVVIDDGLASTKTREIHHDQIKQIDIYQSFLCRLTHTGGIEIAWGENDDERIYIDSIEYPHKVVELIRKQSMQ